MFAVTRLSRVLSAVPLLRHRHRLLEDICGVMQLAPPGSFMRRAAKTKMDVSGLRRMHADGAI